MTDGYSQILVYTKSLFILIALRIVNNIGYKVNDSTYLDVFKISDKIKIDRLFNRKLYVF